MYCQAVTRFASLVKCPIELRHPIRTSYLFVGASTQTPWNNWYMTSTTCWQPSKDTLNLPTARTLTAPQSTSV